MFILVDLSFVSGFCWLLMLVDLVFVCIVFQCGVLVYLMIVDVGCLIGVWYYEGFGLLVWFSCCFVVGAVVFVISFAVCSVCVLLLVGLLLICLIYCLFACA